MLATVLAEPVLQIAALPILWLLCTLAGWLAAAPLGPRTPEDIGERLLLYWVLGATIISWLGTLLAFFGAFDEWAFALLLVALVGWRIYWQRRRARPAEIAPTEKRMPTLASIVAALILIAAGWLYAWPAESYLLTDDSAVYTLGGIALAQGGSLWFQIDPITIPGYQDDGEFWENPQEYTPLFDDFMRQFGTPSRDIPIMTRHFGPFYQPVLYLQSVEIGFLPLPKVWAALCTLLFGPAMAPWAVSFWGLTGLAMVYILTQRLFGWQTALAAMLLLGISFPQVWFSRIHLSEVYAQAFMWGALYLASLARADGKESATSRWLAIASGAVLGGLSIIRFEATIIIAVLAIVLWLRWNAERPRPTWRVHWLIALVTTTILGTALSIGAAPYYYFTRIQSLLRATGVQLPMLALLVVITGGLLVYSFGRLRHWIARAANALPYLVLAAFCAWGAITVWHLVTRDWTQCLAGWLAQYWSLSGLLVSAAGGILLLLPQQRTRILPETHAAWAVGACFLLLFAIHPLVSPIHPWAMRRLVPIVMPVLAISAAWLLVRGIHELAHRILPKVARERWLWPIYALSTLLVAGQVWLTSQPTQVILKHRERQGVWAQLETFAERFPTGSLLLFNNGPVGTRLPQVMEMAFDLPSLVLQDSDAITSDSAIVDRLIASSLDAGNPVYFVLADSSADWHSAPWHLTSMGSQPFDMPVLAYAKGRPPMASDLARHVFWADIYAVSHADATTTRAPGETGGTEPLVVPVGAGSYPYLRSGFYGLEFGVEGRLARWTDDHAEIVIPAMAEPEALELALDIAGGRAPDVAPCHLTVRVQGIDLFDGPLSTSFEPQTLSLPLTAVPAGDAIEWLVEIHCTTWVPDPSGDSRELGVLFYGLRVGPMEGSLGS